MALSQNGNVESDSVGSQETITLQSKTATIDSAFYGTDAAGNPASGIVAADGKSVTITVKPGLNTLTVNLIAKDPAEPKALLFQDMTPLLFVSFRNNGGVGAIPIVGS